MSNIESVPTSRSVRMAPTRSNSNFLGNISIPNKFLLSAALLGIPLLTISGILSNGYYQQAQLAQQQALATAPYAHMEPLQLALRTFRGYEAKNVPRDALDTASKEMAALVESIRQTNIPEAEKISQSLQTKTNSLVDRIRNNNISSDGILSVTGDILNSDLQNLFVTLADKGQLAASPTATGRKLARMSSETLPGLLPQIGAAYGGIIVELGDIASKQKGIMTDAQKVQIQGQIDQANRIVAQVDAQAKDLFQTNPELSNSLQPLFNSALSDTRNALKVASDGSLATGKVTVDSNRLIQVSDAYLASQYKAFAATVKQMNDTFAANQQQAQNKLYTLVAILVGLLILLLLLLRGIIAAITRPLNNLTLASQRLSAGDFTTKVPITSRDELGTLARSFNDASEQLHANELRTQQEREEAARLQGNIGEFLDVTMDIAEGDLTKRGKVTEDVLGNVVDSINLMAEELASVLKDVQNASASVTGGSRAMLSTTEQINEGTQMTAAEAERVARQVQELTAAIREMAQSAQTSAQTARQALLASQQGQEAVSGTLEGMQNVRREVQDIAKRVKGLGDRSLEIQEIVDTIGQIARQTNLLALNAAIEAAGAGEAGGRFTIVADEVRKLADTSGQATSRIAALIKNVQSEIQDVVVRVEEGTREVEQGYRVAGTAGERLREIGALSESSAKLAEQISEATQEQVQGIEQMGQAVAQINNIAQQSAHSVEQGRSAAEQLQQLAGRLNASLSRFRLPN